MINHAFYLFLNMKNSIIIQDHSYPIMVISFSLYVVEVTTQFVDKAGRRSFT